jgi:DNA-binding response OmpR family regulator
MVKRILLAEDDPDIRFILKMVLNDAGYQVEPLSSGDSIVERNCEWPDLFILDKSMPVIDGLALCKYLKIKNETKNIPIIMISCYHQVKNKAEELGVDEFLEKPFDLKLLLEVVDKHMHHAVRAHN